MPIDIATSSPPNASTSRSLSPFDWVLVDANKTAVQVWHDSSDLCAGAKIYNNAAAKQLDLLTEATLHTAVIISLFTDARAGNDDTLPYQQTSRRGWVGAAFLPRSDMSTDDGMNFGSRLWLIYTGKRVDEVLETARFAAFEALQWLIDTGVVDSMDVQTEWRGDSADAEGVIAIRIRMYRSRDRDAQPIYNALWGTTLRLSKPAHLDDWI